MFPCFSFGYGYWWIFPIILIAMMGICFFMMRRHAGSMMCCPGFGRSGLHGENASTDRTVDILNNKNVQGEINDREYETKKEDSVQSR